MGDPVGFDQLNPSSGWSFAVGAEAPPIRRVSTRLPSRPDVNRGNTTEDSDFPASRRIQNQHPIVGHQLPGSTVKEEDKDHYTLSLVGRASSVTDPEFAALYPVKKWAGFSSRQNGRLDRHDRILRQNSPFFGIPLRSVEKFFES